MKRNTIHKRLGACLLCFVLLVGVMPTVAWAARDTTVSTFEDLQNALNNATGTEDNPTVITIDGTIEVTSEIELSRNSNKHIKLTGGTLTCSGLNDNMFGVNSGCSLTL